MAKAAIPLSSGRVIELDGTPEEIAEILRLYSGGNAGSNNQPAPHTRKGSKAAASAPAATAKPAKKGPKTYILELHEADYFGQKRTLTEIQNRLEEQGHIYPQSSLSTPLIRLVRDRVMRRLKVDGVWVYVNG